MAAKEKSLRKFGVEFYRFCCRLDQAIMLADTKKHSLSPEEAMARPSRLASMSIEALMKLRGEVEAALGREVDKLKSQLSKLGVIDVGKGRRRSAMKGRKVPPKYRSRENPRLTWAGRGATPRWMKEEMKKRKLKKEAFLIK